MSHQTLVIIMEGGDVPQTPISRFMRESRDCLTIEAIQQLQACQKILLVICTNRPMIQRICEKQCIPCYDTNSNSTASPSPSLSTLNLTSSLTSFDYLATIQNICNMYAANETISSAMVLGGAAVPLAHTIDLQRLIDSLQVSKQSVWANNPISPDVVGWIPIQSIESIKDVQNDNELAAALRDQAYLQYQMWPRMLTYIYDIDTPIDLWLAVRQKKPAFYITDQNTHNDANHANPAGKLFEPFLDDPFLFGQLELTISNLLDRICKKKLPDITLIGRVSPQTVQFLNQTVKARVRCFSEERGMKGLQRDKQGMVWSLVADWFERFGNYEEAFDLLAQESDAIFMDTRVWMAHHRLELTEEDRFASDLLLEERIGQGKLRELTYAARTCKVPVLLGGFGLVNQGIQLLLQAPE